MAHDFNNLLAVVEGNLEFLLEEEDARALPPEERLEILTGAVSAARRSAELTRGTLAVARKSHLVPRLVDVDEIVRETESWLRVTSTWGRRTFRRVPASHFRCRIRGLEPSPTCPLGSSSPS